MGENFSRSHALGQIALSNIRKSFGDTRVLGGVDLAIDTGEFLTLVGPSGCGKSTLLRILAGLEMPDSGEVRIDGHVVNNTRPAERNLAMVFQSYALYPHLTVAGNMITPLRLRDLSFHERLPLIGPMLARGKYRHLRARVEDTARILKIEALLERKPGQLSGGQRQRAALGRAMVRKPVAFLMDEPLSNLDAALRVHMRSELAELHRALGVTFVYVTHDQAEALTMSDRMAVMMDGDILQFDRPDVIYNDPVDQRVAEFVGSPKINILPGEIATDGRVSYLDMQLDRRVVGLTRGPVSVGLRPEHIVISDNPGSGTFSGTVIHRENLGSDIYLHLGVADGAYRLQLRATPEDAMNCAVGNTVHARCVNGEALVFSADGKRLRSAARSAPSPHALVQKAVA